MSDENLKRQVLFKAFQRDTRTSSKDYFTTTVLNEVTRPFTGARVNIVVKWIGDQGQRDWVSNMSTVTR